MADLVAFDIDGVLTKEEGMDILLEQAQTTDNIVGIITARPEIERKEFVFGKGLCAKELDFATSATFKGRAMRSLEERFNTSSGVYYGSWTRDRVHAALAGWEYHQL